MKRENVHMYSQPNNANDYNYDKYRTREVDLIPNDVMNEFKQKNIIGNKRQGGGI